MNERMWRARGNRTGIMAMRKTEGRENLFFAGVLFCFVFCDKASKFHDFCLVCWISDLIDNSHARRKVRAGSASGQF